MFKLDSVSVAKRLAVVIGSAVLGIILMAAAFLVSERALILDERQNAVRQAVEIAQGIAVHFHGQVAKGAR